MEDFLALYSEAGMIGVVGAMFMFMVYSMNKRGNEQAEALKIGVNSNLKKLNSNITFHFCVCNVRIRGNQGAGEPLCQKLPIGWRTVTCVRKCPPADLFQIVHSAILTGGEILPEF